MFQPQSQQDTSSAQQDNRSNIHKQFDKIAVRCTSILREVSDAGEVLCPHHIRKVHDAIVKELFALHGLAEPPIVIGTAIVSDAQGLSKEQ